MQLIKVHYIKNWFFWFCIGFFVFCLGAKWTVIHQYGSDIPYMDQWNGEGTAIILPWLEGEWNFIESFWEPHNEHRIGWTRLWSLGWVLLNDQWDPLLVTTVNSIVHLSVGLVLIFILRKFFYGKMYWLGPLIIVSIYSIPIAWENTLQAFQIQVYLSLGCALFVLSTLTNCKLNSFSGVLGVIMAFAGIPCLSAAFAPPAAILIVRNLRAYKSRTLDKHDILVSATCLITLFLALLSINSTPGHEPFHAQSFFQFIEFFIKICSIPFHQEHWFLRLVAASLLQAPFLLFIVKLFRKNGKDWQKCELTLFALGTWLFLQTAAISYSRGNIGIGTRHLDTFAILLVTNATSLIYLINLPIKNSRFKIKSLSIIWTTLACIGLVSFSRSEIKSNLVNFPHTLRTMKVHIHDFITENNATKFQQVPISSLPFISHPFMMNFLQNEKVKNILPVGIRKPVNFTEFKNIGFNNELTHNFLREENSKIRYYSTISSHSYWESEEMMTKSVLPILRIKFAGHSDLSTSSIRIESGGKMHPLKIKHFNGKGWQSAHLFIPQEFDTFKFVAECKDPNKWLAFEEPFEIGFGSWLAHQFRKKSYLCLFMGMSLMIFSIFVKIKFAILKPYSTP